MSTSQSPKILSVDSLAVQFEQDAGSFPALNFISFSLYKGESLGIVGESGSGKTLTGLSILRLLPQTKSLKQSGEITYFPPEGGRVILSGLPERKMKLYRGSKIAMIFQEPMTSLNPTMRCGTQVMETLILHQKISRKDARSKTIGLFEEVLLPRAESLFRSYPHQLSGGQKQRVMIAMALACHPDILIADEPTTALDVTVQKSILGLLKALQVKYGMSLIFISHDLGVVSDITDRLLVMHRGIIVEEGNKETIFNNPGHPYTRGLLACRPPLGVRPMRLSVVNDFLMSNSCISHEAEREPERIARHQKMYDHTPLIAAKELSKKFILSRKLWGKPILWVDAVQNLTIEVYRGETLGIVGESGSGKSTLGRMLIRLLASDTGKIIYDNRDMERLDHKELRSLRKKVQIIFQDPYSSLNPSLTAGECLMEPMKVHKLFPAKAGRKERAMELLAKTGLDKDHFNRYPHELSGGQRQRLCIARALAVEPEFIICDESVSALDVSVQAQVLNLLNDLKREFSLTYVFISHDLAVVRYMSDRIVVMQEGRIVETGEADRLFALPQSEYTRNLLDAIPGRAPERTLTP